MKFDISSKTFALRLSAEEAENLPPGLEQADDDGNYRLEFHDEGFDEADYESVLSKATQKNILRVNYMDAEQRCDSFDVVFGPGFCERES